MCGKFIILVMTFSVISQLSSKCNANTELNVGVLLELSNYWFSGFVRMFVHVIEYAIEAIDERKDLLDGFTLKMTVRDTKVHMM